MFKNSSKITLSVTILIIFSLIALKFLPLLKYYKNHGDAYLLMRYNSDLYLAIVLGLLIIGGVYIWIDQKLIKNPPKISVILGTLAIISLVLILVFPIGASDIFLYLFQARTFAIHGLNPYINTYSQLTNDALYPFLKNNYWIGNTSSYGPLFIIIMGGLSLVFKSSFLASILLLKSFFAVLHLINTWLVDKTLGRRSAWLYAFNPLIIFEFLVNGHNEVVMIFFCLASFYFLWQKTPNLKNSLLSIFFLTLATLIKFIPLILLPIWGLALLYRLNNKKEKLFFIGLSIPLAIITILLTYQPFWQGYFIIFKPITSQMAFSSHLLSSPLINFIYIALTSANINISWANAILISQVLFLGFLLFITGKIIQKRKSLDVKKIINYGTIIMIAFYASFFSWLMPWYFTFLLLLLLISYRLSNQKHYLIIFHAITILEIIYYLILR